MLSPNSQTLMVIMPVFNSEKTLHNAIKSVLDQSLKNLRLVIVDDASTDSSLEIAQTFATDSRVSILKNKKNFGAYYSRNVGLHFVNSMPWGYFTTHDADDVSFANRYLKAIRLLKGPRSAAVQDAWERVDLKRGTVLSAGLTMAHAIFTRNVFESLGYFEQVRFGADWEYWKRLGVYCLINQQKTLQLNEVVGKSFIHENNLTVKIPEKSQQRKKYIESTRKNIKKMSAQNNIYRHFVLNKASTETVL